MPADWSAAGFLEGQRRAAQMFCECSRPGIAAVFMCLNVLSTELAEPEAVPASQVSSSFPDGHAAFRRVDDFVNLGSAYGACHLLADILAGQLLQPFLQARWRCSRCPTSCRVQAPSWLCRSFCSEMVGVNTQ